MNDYDLDEVEIKKIKKSARKGCISIVIMVLLVFVVSLIFLFKGLEYMFKPSEELIASSESSDGKYKVEAYLVNGGMTTDWAVRCDLIISNKKKKKVIYSDYHIDKAIMTWIDEDTININNHEIDLPNGKYDFKKK